MKKATLLIALFCLGSVSFAQTSKPQKSNASLQKTQKTLVKPNQAKTVSGTSKSSVKQQLAPKLLAVPVEKKKATEKPTKK